MFDIFIAVCEKDYNKLPYVIKSIKEYIDFNGDIHICSPFSIKNKQENIIYHLDEDVLPVDRFLWKYRPSWMYMQCLRLFQEVTNTNFLCIDADTFINRKLNFFEDNKLILYTGISQYFSPFFNFQKKMINIEQVYPQTFITDFCMFNRNIINEILEKNNYKDKFEFIKKSQEITTNECMMCDQDLYKSYYFINYKNNYIIKPLKMKKHIGKYQNRLTDQIYTNAEIENEININKDKDYDTFALHSWCNENA
jgi:hypothetical protein